jgi:hypothetical protein
MAMLVIVAHLALANSSHFQNSLKKNIVVHSTVGCFSTNYTIFRNTEILKDQTFVKESEESFETCWGIFHLEEWNLQNKDMC